MEPEQFGPWPGTPGPWWRKPGERFKHDNSAGVTGPDGLYLAAALDFNDRGREDEVEHNAIGIAMLPDAYEALRLVLNTAERLSPQPGAAYVVQGEVILAARLTLRRMAGENGA